MVDKFLAESKKYFYLIVITLLLINTFILYFKLENIKKEIPYLGNTFSSSGFDCGLSFKSYVKVGYEVKIDDIERIQCEFKK